jgi:hypothetical protein
VLFSGDLGNDNRPILRDPSSPPKADAVVMETTYGDRLHKPIDQSVEELYAAISDTFTRGGNVIIPTFFETENTVTRRNQTGGVSQFAYSSIIESRPLLLSDSFFLRILQPCLYGY